MILDLIKEWKGELTTTLLTVGFIGLFLLFLRYFNRFKIMQTEIRTRQSRDDIENKILKVQSFAIEVEALVLLYLEQRQRDPISYMDHALFMRNEEKDAVIKDLSRSRDILFHADCLLSIELNKSHVSDGELVDLSILSQKYLEEIINIERRINMLLHTKRPSIVKMENQ